MRKFIFAFFVGFFSFGSSISLSFAAETQGPLIFSISPERNVSALAQTWLPILAELEERTGLEFQFATAGNAQKFNQRLTEENIHITFVDPYAFASSFRKKYSAIAKPKTSEAEAPPLGIIVVNKTSNHQRLEDLSGKAFTFSDAESFSASLLPRFHMQATGTPYKASFSRSSISSAISVSRGLHDAAGIEVSVYNSLPDQIRDKLRIVWTSTPSDLCQGMKNHPFVFAVNKNLSKKLTKKIQSALVNLHKTEKGRQLLAPLGFKRIKTASNGEWSGVARLASRVINE